MGDILNESGSLMTLEEMSQVYHINMILNIFQNKKLVSDNIKQSRHTDDFNFIWPHAPFYIQYLKYYIK